MKSEFVPAPAVPRVHVPNAQAQEPQAGVVLGAEPAAVRGAGAVPRKPLAASGLPARLGAHRGSHELQLRGHVPAGAHRLVARSAAEPTQAAVADRAERQPRTLSCGGGQQVRVTSDGQASLSLKMAEGEGFEPPVRFPVQWFSRPPVSTAHASLRLYKSATYNCTTV